MAKRALKPFLVVMVLLNKMKKNCITLVLIFIDPNLSAHKHIWLWFSFLFIFEFFEPLCHVIRLMLISCCFSWKFLTTLFAFVGIQIMKHAPHCSAFFKSIKVLFDCWNLSLKLNMVVSNSSFPSSEHFVLICNSLNRKIPRSFIVAKR